MDKVKFGSVSDVNYLDQNGSKVTNEKVYVRDGMAKRIKVFKYIIKVTDSQSETSEFIKWSDEVRSHKESGKLCLDKDYIPGFSVRYPGVDKDGSYIVIKSWAIEY